MSDSHGNYNALEKIVIRNLNADLFIHLGDGQRELELISDNFPQKNFRHVKGNCDLASLSPAHLSIRLTESVLLFAAHGHTLNVKYSLEGIINSAQQSNAAIAAFGHTHCGFLSYQNGLHIINPGSASVPRDGKPPSYAFVDITDAGIAANIVYL